MIQKDRGDIIKDTIVKEYIGNPEIFADVFNFFLYDGEQKIKPENLTEKDVTELVTLPVAIKGQELSGEVDVSIKRSQMHKRSKRKTDGSNSAQKHRDLLKFAAMMQDSYANYVILGVENQMEVHYAMPVRNMVYDALQYDKQVAMIAADNRRNKRFSSETMRNNGEFLSGFLRTDKILPVITLTLYFGTEPWDGPLSLREMYDINDSKLLDFVPDYRVQLIQPMTLSEDDFEKFHTSLREVLQTIKYSVDAQKLTEYITQNERMHRLDLSAANVINTVAGIGLEIKQDRGKVDMCKAIEDLKAESRAEGREEGHEEGHTKGRAETIEQTVAMLRNMKIPKETILSQLQRTFSLSEEEADRIYNAK